MSKPFCPHLLIGNIEIPASRRASLPIFNPATGTEIARMPIATAEDVDMAAAQAAAAFELWKHHTPEARAAVFRSAAAALDDQAGSLSEIITLEQGKLLSEAFLEVQGVSGLLRWAAEKLLAMRAEQPLRDGPVQRQRRFEPLGVIAIASPWNFPLAAAADHAIAALAMGCTAVIKPPESCPSAVAAFAHILIDCGLPPGAMNVVTGEPGPIVSQLIAHDRIRKIAYTGSTDIGRRIAHQAAECLKPTVLELGGNAPVIVGENADIENAANHIANRKFANAGQNCVAPNRIYVHARLYDGFCEAVVSRARMVKLGDGHDAASTMGPLATARQRARIARLISSGLSDSGRVLYGISSEFAQGYFHAPAVVADVSDNSALFREEIFGPVIALARYDDEETLLKRVNSSSAGLAGYVFAGDQARAAALADRLEVGMIGINTCSVSSYDLPFGGIKSSGWGAVYGDEGLREFVHPQARSWLS